MVNTPAELSDVVDWPQVVVKLTGQVVYTPVSSPFVFSTLSAGVIQVVCNCYMVNTPAELSDVVDWPQVVLGNLQSRRTEQALAVERIGE
ncbi:hypothetical protein J6590_016394 [Homalodisca vitripennis]|nr:hypothetical protein J6590_016394 [Homalodisca vitripennis]